MKKLIALCFVLSTWISQAQEKTLTGLWLVSSVEVGEEMMTPDSRWIRFLDDGTQEGGNGWRKHSYGEYLLEDSHLSVNDFNGVSNEFGPFEVVFNDNENMTWTRVENDMTVTVRLIRVEEVPPTAADQLIGVWKLVETNGVPDESSSSFIYLAWDNAFLWDNGHLLIRGMYRVHPHRPQLVLVENRDEPERFVFEFVLGEGFMELHSSSDQGQFVQKFVRSHEF